MTRLLQVELEIPATALPAVEAMLESAGALSVSLADPGGEPVLEPGPGETPLWDRVVVSALFDPGIDRDALLARLSAVSGEPTARIGADVLPARDWIREFREALKPLRFGDRLWICPGDIACPDPAGVVLRLDPGLAFGSGSHATTAMCLDWLCGLDLAGRSVLDWGCGSGVLAIGALALGARRATGLDIDPQALLATRENARANGVESGLGVGLPDSLPAGERHDVLVANILANSLVELAPRFRAHCVAGAPVAMSGILDAQAEQVRRACATHFALEVTASRDGWSLLSGTAI